MTKKIGLNEIMYCGITQEIESTIVYWAFDTTKNDCVEFIEGIEEAEIKFPLLKFPKIDEIVLYRQYIDSLNDKEITERFKNVNDDELDYEFKIFCHDYAPEIWDNWCDYESSVVRKITKKWCIENNIPYVENRIPKD